MTLDTSVAYTTAICGQGLHNTAWLPSMQQQKYMELRQQHAVLKLPHPCLQSGFEDHYCCCVIFRFFTPRDDGSWGGRLPQGTPHGGRSAVTCAYLRCGPRFGPPHIARRSEIAWPRGMPPKVKLAPSQLYLCGQRSKPASEGVAWSPAGRPAALGGTITASSTANGADARRGPV